MRIVFMGTPDFAVPTLETLIQSDHTVVGVVTQPDRPRGRSGKLQFSPVKETAVEADIPVFQPEQIKDGSFLPTLQELAPDVIIVVAFGQILPKDVLELPEYGCINVHASLLPKLRGAAPIQWSVIDGDAKSGVTIMQMDEGLDTGDILLTKTYTLDEKETGGSLFDKLAGFGGPMVLEVLKQAEQGDLHPTPQGEEYTYAKMLSKETGRLDFTKSAVELERLIRGLNPWPSAYTMLGDKMLKLWEADVISSDEQEKQGVSKGQPGEVVLSDKKFLWIQTGDGCLAVQNLQLAGKKRMETNVFLRGVSIEKGTILAG
ncbi:MAG: methionyl-tRNA formyltransferase [Lachnospiraceae bacterium]|nr:methionyl-tRNA formyltransferase [Lachnospiraceae bacterium]